LLVLPECHSPNLISRFMKLMLGRLSEDWLERWGHPLALVESFVDPEWAMVEAAARAHCTTPVKEIHSLMDSVRQGLPEFRRTQALGYPLAGMICLIVMALATGVRQGPDDLAQFADTLSQAQLRALGFRRDKHTLRYRCPKKTTFTRVLAGVDAGRLQPILLDWQRRLTGPIQDSLVIIDGKKMRHGGVEMVNATDGQGQYLGGMITEAKSNEIPAARQVLKPLELTGKIVLADALHTQVETAQQILYEQGGHYLMTVKANQPTLQATLQGLFEKQAFSPSGHAAHASAPTRAQPGPTGNSLSGVPGSDSQPSGIPGSPLGGSLGNPSQTRGQMDPRSGLPVEQPDAGGVAGPGNAPTQTEVLGH
jgi:hypothetical protein